MEPHASQPTLVAGADLRSAEAAMILVHGRGADARDMIGLAAALDRPRFACLAPSAAGHTWYPNTFMAPRDLNEPGISSGLSVIDGLVADLLARGLPAERIVIGGFSQGACLSSEYAVRHPRRFGAVLAFSGGLIGPPGMTWDDLSTARPLSGVPVVLGCSDVDPHIPQSRVLESEVVFTALGARVTRKLYPGMGHTINEDELAIARTLLDAVLASPR